MEIQLHVRATVPEKAKAQGGVLRWRWIVYAVIALIILGAVLSGLLGGR
jgi:hypothetical protein